VRAVRGLSCFVGMLVQPGPVEVLFLVASRFSARFLPLFLTWFSNKGEATATQQSCSCELS